LARLWWLLLLCWAAPLLWGGWWWWSLVVGVPAGLVGEVGIVSQWEEKRAAKREATAVTVRPGEVLDVPPEPQGGTDHARSGSTGSEPASPRPAAVRVPVPGTPARMFTATGARTLAYAPRGQVLAVGCANGEVQLWSGVGTSAPLQVGALAHPGALTALGFSPTGRLLVTASDQGSVTVWDVSSPSRPVGLATVVHCDGDRPVAVHCVDVGADGRLASGGADGRIVVWDLAQPRRPQRVAELAVLGGASRRRRSTTENALGVMSVRFSPDARLLAAGGGLNSSRPVQLWNLTGLGTPERVARLRPHKPHAFGDGRPVCHALAFSPRRPLLVTVSEYDYQVHPPSEYIHHHPYCHDSAVVVWDVRDPANPEGLVTLTERGGDRVTGWRNQPLRVTPTTLAGHAETARCLGIGPDGTRLVTGDENTLLLWNITDPARPAHLRTIPIGGLRAVAFSPDGRQVSSASSDGRVATWATSSSAASPDLGS
jgi:WD40 repeat protein